MSRGRAGVDEFMDRAGLQVAQPLVSFIETQALPGLGLDTEAVWRGVADIFARFVPDNRALLGRRDALQAEIDAWCEARKGSSIAPADYAAFLREIGYLVEEPAAFAIDPRDVDAEVAALAGPQLVVPVLNARFLLNAANARWGSLYDALYGTDAIPGAPAGKGYDPDRGAQVIAWAKAFLDRAAPLVEGLARRGDRLCRPGRGAGSSFEGPRRLRRLPRRSRLALRHPAAASRPAHRDRHRPGERHRRW